MFKNTCLFGLALLVKLAIAHPIDERGPAVKVINNCKNQGQVAWTFDDGPYQWEQQVSDALNGGKATFFLNGNNFQVGGAGCIYDHADTVRALYAAGHTLASHSWSHFTMTQLNETQINDELQRVETAFIKILGVKPLYFRPPYGAYNDLMIKVLNDRGYRRMFLWSDYTTDANGGTLDEEQAVMDSVIKDYPNPHMILSHTTIQSTADTVVPKNVPLLQNAGYQLVTVNDCLGLRQDNAYQKVKRPEKPNSSWHC